MSSTTPMGPPPDGTTAGTSSTCPPPDGTTAGISFASPLSNGVTAGASAMGHLTGRVTVGPSSMGPPPDRAVTGSSVLDENTSPSAVDSSSASNQDCLATDDIARPVGEKRPSVPYVVPEWSGPPCHKYYLEVLKNGTVIDQLSVSEKGAYMFGRVDRCDFILEHPTISRFHAVLQFKRSGDAYVFDTGSTHGTFVNKKQVEKRVHVKLHVGDILRFGQSSRLYIFQGPTNLMPLEADINMLRKAKIKQELMDQEESLLRAKVDASLSNGISWGMGEDAFEEIVDDSDEITWQTYKGNLTERQEKTRDKILKRTEKIAHMKKEIDAIRAKDIPQGGLTQGQQTQIARNELRITQIMEELENLEETLNDSIRESVGARSGMYHGKNKGALEDNNLMSDDDDDFYDRTRKPSKLKASESETVTADSLIDKRDAIMKEIDDKKRLLSMEADSIPLETNASAATGDSLDDFMSAVSSQLVLDKTTRLEKEISSLQVELDRILFLLKIADPSGEASKLRVMKANMKPVCVKLETLSNELRKIEPKKSTDSEAVTVAAETEVNKSSTAESNVKEERVSVSEQIISKKVAYNPMKPQWLGAITDNKPAEDKAEDLSLDNSDQFVDYKDRQKILSKVDDDITIESEIERAAPGLIIRKRKEKEKSPTIDDNGQSETSTSTADVIVEDAVALLLKHKTGYYDFDEDPHGVEDQETAGEKELFSENKRLKRALGPERPTFLKSHSDYESWLPPEGQSGDGRTSLNERFGY